MKKLTVAEAIKRMPKFLGSYDPMVHTSIDALLMLAQTELDFYYEGLDSCDAPDITNKRQLRAVQKYIALLKENQ